MATYNIIEQSIRAGGRVLYLMQLDSEEGVELTYPTVQTQATLDAQCDILAAEKAQRISDQEKIDKALAEALWTDEERAHLG